MMQHPPYPVPVPGLVRLPSGRIVTLASPARRLFARVFDTSLCIAVLWGLLEILRSPNPDAPLPEPLIGVYFPAVLIGPLIAEWAQLAGGGCTLGQRLLGMRVVNIRDDGRLSPGRALLRAILYCPIPLTMTCGLPLLAPAVFTVIDVLHQTWDTPLQQCLHDKAAGTTVIHNHRPLT